MSADIKENINVLDTLLENEKKSKTFTILTIIGFCLLAIVIIYQTSKISLAEKHVQQELNEKKLAYAKLDSALILLDNLQDSLENINKLLSNTVSESHTTVSGNGSHTANYKCYIQFMPGFEAEAKKAYYAMLKKDWYDKFTVVNEKIEGQAFNSYIKYFNKKDDSLATKMYNTLVEANINMDKKPVYVELPGTSNKFELWLGKNKRKSLEEILKKPRYQNAINQSNRMN